jgi:cysteine desulfurase/selenocysteine lyase
MGFETTVRRHFPFLAAREGIAYLDSAATTQQPLAAIDAVRDRAMQGVGGVHRGLHPLSDESTRAFENARAACAEFLHAAHDDEIAFTSGTTLGLNLVALGMGERWGEDDAVAVTALDHHSNLTPWLHLKERRGVDVRWIGIDRDGRLNEDDVETAFRDGRVRMLAVTGQSNVLGVRPDLATLVATARKHGALVCVDAAQLAAHAPIDVQRLDCDFLACSGHKLYGPTGIGILYGKRGRLAELPPMITGGGMVRTVTKDGFVPSDAPARFMAGTPHVLGAVGLAAALAWQKQFAWEDRVAHEKNMIALLLEELRGTGGVRMLGPADGSVSGCVSFTIDGVHPHDAAEVLGSNGVCVRAGHHCAQPLHEALGIVASVRASIGIYTNEDDVRRLKPAILEAQKILLR